MCLGVPARVVALQDGRALVETRGRRHEVDVRLVDARVGDYLVVQYGMALEVMDRAAAEETLRAWEVVDA